MTSTMQHAMPDQSTTLAAWGVTWQALVEWANNDTLDIKSGVDAQRAYLYSDDGPLPRPDSNAIRQYGTRADEKENLSKLMLYKAERLLHEGTLVRLLDAHDVGVPDNQTGKTGRVIRIELDTIPFGLIVLMDEAPNYEWSLRTQHVELCSPVNSEQAPAEPTAEEQRIIALETELRRKEAEIRARRMEMAELAEYLREQAQKNDLCGQYEAAVSEANARFSYIELLPREKTFTVSISYTVSDRGVRTYEVQATDEESAQTQAEEMFENESAQELWNAGQGSEDIEQDDVEVEEN